MTHWFTSNHPPSRRLELLITVFGLLGLALFVLLYDQAFPAAALDLKLSRDDIAQRAQAYMQAQGYDLRGYEFALTFGEDGWASTYLQLTLGIPETNRRVRAEHLPVWAWHARWFRPLQKEEFSLSLSPEGNVTGFSHGVLENAPGAKLAQDQARVLAEDYMVHDRQWTLADWEPVTVFSSDKPGGRADHDFEWKRRNAALGEAELRLSVGVQGDRIGSYGYWIKVPEAFTRHFEEQQNRADFVNGLSYMAGFIGLGVAVVIAYLLAVWRGVLRWRAGLAPALIGAGVSLLAGLNTLLLNKAWYGTTQDYTLFWAQRGINLLFAAVVNIAFLLILWSGARQLGQLVWPRQDKILPRSDDRWRTLAVSSWRGLMLGGLSAGYVILFYLIATRLFGSWTPLDTPFTGAYATPLPFLGPLQMGLLPALEEELLFRLAGISVILWLLRRVRLPKGARLPEWLCRAAALLVPGLLWAFAHVAYVRDPFYLRGIELGIEAVLLSGLFFLQFDLMTTMVAHFFWNATLGALPLLRSGQPYFVVSGLIVIAVMVTPLIPGLVSVLRRRKTVMRPPTRVTPASPEDTPALSRLVESVDWAVWLNDPAALVLCLRAGEDIVGVAAGRVGTEGAGQVCVVCVKPDWRRRYGGSALVDELSTRLRERGAQSIEAPAQASDRIATAFWASQGWRPRAYVFARSWGARPSLDGGNRLARLWAMIKEL